MKSNRNIKWAQNTSALINEEEHLNSDRVLPDKGPELEDKDFPWHVKVALILVIIVTAGGCLFLARSDNSQDLTKAAAATVWTTYSIGNPSTVHFANVRLSRLDETVLCGRVNYEKAENGGWSGYTDFFVDKGVMYISPPAGKFAKQFNDLCLVLPEVP